MEKAKISRLICLLGAITMLVFLSAGAIHADSMTVSMAANGTTEEGDIAVRTVYESTSQAANIIGQNRYLLNVHGFGSPTTVNQSLSVGSSSDIEAASTDIVKERGDGTSLSMLRSTEKIGTGVCRQSTTDHSDEYFEGAAGSALRVTETEHHTDGATDSGSLSYSVASAGKGEIRAAAAADHQLYADIEGTWTKVIDETYNYNARVTGTYSFGFWINVAPPAAE